MPLEQEGMVVSGQLLNPSAEQRALKLVLSFVSPPSAPKALAGRHYQNEVVAYCWQQCQLQSVELGQHPLPILVSARLLFSSFASASVLHDINFGKKGKDKRVVYY